VVPGGRSFTLIELLVVIAIIAILAGLILPALQHAQEQGRQMKCLNHHRQLAIGVLLYADDANDRLPGMWDNVAGDGVSGGWVFYRKAASATMADPTIRSATGMRSGSARIWWSTPIRRGAGGMSRKVSGTRGRTGAAGGL
jgi:prepilin-type N-terminal cleavage/methylation domain-containing protein